MTWQKNFQKPFKKTKNKLDYFIYLIRSKMFVLFRKVCNKLFTFVGIRNVIVIVSVI